MPRIQPVTLDNTDATTAATLKAAQAKLGMLPNMFTTLAQAPAALAAYLQFNDVMSRGRLSAAQREMIAIAVAQENACEYCLSAHAAIGGGVGLDAQDIERARTGGAREALDAAVTGFALQVVRRRGGVTDAELEAARNAGLDDGLIVETVVNVALNVLTNYTNRVAATEVDFPVVVLSPAA